MKSGLALSGRTNARAQAGSASSSAASRESAQAAPVVSGARIRRKRRAANRTAVPAAHAKSSRKGVALRRKPE